MNPFTMISLIAFFIYLLLGIHALIIDSKSRFNRISAFLCMDFALVSLLYVIWSIQTAKPSSLFWKDLFTIAEFSLAAIGLHFTLLFTKNDNWLSRRWATLLIYLPAMVLGTISAFPSPYRLHNVLFDLSLILTNLIYATLIFYLVFHYRKLPLLTREKKQVDGLLFSAIISMVLVVLNISLTIAYGAKQFPFIPHVWVLSLAFGIIYVIIRYSFLQISSLISAEEILQQVTDLIVLIDTAGKITETNARLRELLGYSDSEMISHNFRDFTANPVAYLESFFTKGGQRPRTMQLHYLSKSGNPIPVTVHFSVVNDSFGEPAGVIAIGQDLRPYRRLELEIDERKSTEQKLKFISWHDQLTGLYNRTFFEQEMQRCFEEHAFPISLILCDVDGLKLANDTQGHDAGDQLLITVAAAISAICPNSGCSARIGGDEFAMLLPGVDQETLRQYAGKIRNAVQDQLIGDDQLPVSISLGYATAVNALKTKQDIFREADNYMYGEKLNHGQSRTNSLVQILTRMLAARDFITEGHADRLQDLVVETAVTIGLPDGEIPKIQLLARFHDIGKVGVPDRILFKPGPLTTEEMAVMRRHCEIGYRIANASADLIPIADSILKHHEWWNGNGYPLGLKGNEIPVHDRILAIADAYDAMTNDRPYRKAIPKGLALKELKQNAGSQFDPELVRVFVKLRTCEGGL